MADRTVGQLLENPLSLFFLDDEPFHHSLQNRQGLPATNFPLIHRLLAAMRFVFIFTQIYEASPKPFRGLDTKRGGSRRKADAKSSSVFQSPQTNRSIRINGSSEPRDARFILINGVHNLIIAIGDAGD